MTFLCLYTATRFLVLFALDIFSALVNATSLCVYPSYVNKKNRLKLARIESIERRVQTNIIKKQY